VTDRILPILVRLLLFYVADPMMLVSRHAKVYGMKGSLPKDFLLTDGNVNVID